MFTGIIEELGTARSIQRRAQVSVLRMRASKVLEGTKIGDSIAVNGVCLTVVAIGDGTLDFEVMPQTLSVTGLGRIRTGEQVNLERALQLGDRVSGHFVSGHIDCQGVIRTKLHRGGNLIFEVAVPSEFHRYIVAKGSIALDGISLTIAEKKPFGLSVYIIPHTLKNTTLSFKGPGHTFNVECDILLKKPA